MSIDKVAKFVLAMAIVIATASAGEPTNKRFRSLEVKAFEVPGDIGMPMSFQDGLTADLIAELGKAGMFELVFREGTMSNAVPEPVLQLVGRITRFDKGSQFKRWMIGPGFGKTIIKAHAQFIDRQTGTVVFEKNVDGKVIMGLYGGDSVGATRGVAKEVVKTAKNYFRKTSSNVGLGADSRAAR